MSQNAFSMLAVIAALTFLAMALAACASTEQTAAAHYAVYKGNGVAEFHQAQIGADDLRGDLPSEN